MSDDGFQWNVKPKNWLAGIKHIFSIEKQNQFTYWRQPPLLLTLNWSQCFNCCQLIIWANISGNNKKSMFGLWLVHLICVLWFLQPLWVTVFSFFPAPSTSTHPLSLVPILHVLQAPKPPELQANKAIAWAEFAWYWRYSNIDGTCILLWIQLQC